MQHEPFSTQEIAAVMLGRKLTIPQVNDILFARHGYVERRLIRNRVYNMTKSKNVVIRMETDGYVKTWHLVSASPCYFRKSSLTRHMSRGEPAKVHHKATKGRIYVRPAERPSEVNACRLANAVFNAIRTGEWIEPELIEENRKNAHKKTTGTAGARVAPQLVTARYTHCLQPGVSPVIGAGYFSGGRGQSQHLRQL